MNTPVLTLRSGMLDERERREAARIYYEAFAHKLEHLELFPHSREQGEQILAGSFVPELGIFAFDGQELLGVVGLDTSTQGEFVTIRRTALVETFGLVGGVTRWIWRAINRLFIRPEPGEMRIAGIAVAAAARGRGVGSALLDAVVDRARAEGFRAVVLEVVDSNPAARKLYERLGFVVTHTEHYGLFTRAAGFTSAAYMRLQL